MLPDFDWIQDLNTLQCVTRSSHVFSFLNCYKIPGEMMADDSWQRAWCFNWLPQKTWNKKKYSILIISNSYASEKSEASAML